MCDMMVPPLSTMKVRKRELGATAVQRLLDRVADPKRECLKMAFRKLQVPGGGRFCPNEGGLNPVSYTHLILM